jgi:hypothetical protein
MKAKERELALRQESVMAQEAAFSARESAVLARETALSTQELYLAGRLHEEAEERKRLSDLAVTMANQRAAFEAEMNVARAAWMDFEAKREAFEKTKDAWERERGGAKGVFLGTYCVAANTSHVQSPLVRFKANSRSMMSSKLTGLRCIDYVTYIRLTGIPLSNLFNSLAIKRVTTLQQNSQLRSSPYLFHHFLRKLAYTPLLVDIS